MAPVFRPGKKAYLKFVHHATTMNMSSGVETGELARMCDALNVSHWGQDDEVNIAGIRKFTLKANGPWASTYETFLALCLGSSAAIAFTFGPESTVSGRRKYTGSLILTNYPISAPAQSMVGFSVDCVGTGAVTSTTF